MTISFVIPTLNEEKNLGELIKKIRYEMKKRGLKHEIIVIDGHSTDRTVEIAKKFDSTVLLDENGKGSALRKGFQAAKGDIVVSIDADLSHEPKEIGLLLEAIEGGYDICMGSRFILGGGTKDMEIYRKFGNKFFVFMVNSLYGAHYSDMCYGYRAIRKSALKKIELSTDGFGIETEISIEAAKKGLKIIEVPSFEKKRKDGIGKLKTMSDGLEILKIIIGKMTYEG